LQRVTPYTQTDPVLLQAELQRVKAQGFCIVDQEYEIGMRVLGVPLLDRAGQLQATLTITTHASRLSMDEIRLRYLPALYEAQALLRPVLG
ncbi:IclR family transcriptional regulator domain-containing protein, partial [Pseudomonas juntendi]|uniref:IclR family transcriptional regulator domain-containing protein n=1 Tax=Pseudomonas juntendi TaxID=2666183 RepID=UPI0024951503